MSPASFVCSDDAVLVIRGTKYDDTCYYITFIVLPLSLSKLVHIHVVVWIIGDVEQDHTLCWITCIVILQFD